MIVNMVMKIYVVAQLTLVLAVFKAARACDCNLTAIGTSDIKLAEYMGRWYEIRYNATDHPEEDSWWDYSETYIPDARDDQKVQIIYSSRAQGEQQCSYIVSKRLFYYTGSGTFILSKNKLNYTYLVVNADLSNYKYAVVVMCPYILPSGCCNTTIDVKTFSRFNKPFDNYTESIIRTYFEEELTCIDYDRLRSTKHSESACPPYEPGAAVSLVTGSDKLIMLIAFVLGSLCTRRGFVAQ